MTTLHSMSDRGSSSKVSGDQRSLQPWGSTISPVCPTGVTLKEPHLGGFLQRTPRTPGHLRTVPAAQARRVGSSVPGLPQRPPGWSCSPRLWCPLVLTLGVPRKGRQTHAGKIWGPLVSGPTGVGDARGKHQSLEVWAALALYLGPHMSQDPQTRGCQAHSLWQPGFAHLAITMSCHSLSSACLGQCTLERALGGVLNSKQVP